MFLKHLGALPPLIEARDRHNRGLSLYRSSPTSVIVGAFVPVQSNIEMDKIPTVWTFRILVSLFF